MGRPRRNTDRPLPDAAAGRPPDADAGARPSPSVPDEPNRAVRGGDRLRHLDRLAVQLIDDGLAPATRRAYAAGTRRFRRFCRRHGLCPQPATESTVLRFVADGARRGHSAGAITVHLAGVRQWHIRHGAAWAGRTERVRLAIRGAAKRPRPPRLPRLAATPGHLRALRRSLRSGDLTANDRAAAWAAVLLGFFGALRGSEYLAPAAHSHHHRRTCQWRHISTHRDRLEVQLPASTTDQLYTGTVVSLPKLGGPCCPVRAMRRYRTLRPAAPPDQPVFVRSTGAYCTPGWLNGVLRRAALTDTGKITTHSLRIGFATAAAAAAAAGVTESVLQVSGRWRGSSYLRYVRGPRLAVWEACRAIV
ncbi:uncharacterized protein LOC122379432 [Amphibalanus amphitrite]|uniref:uncharacterized protein LOC122379432 n=1 Tax=Amphibalanus amphitrite TaxID=1232801 RepID=UPI001C922EC9|nr:uncharacterized protein LOC122379432 [Amphibalanus amphitrite]